MGPPIKKEKQEEKKHESKITINREPLQVRGKRCFLCAGLTDKMDPEAEDPAHYTLLGNCMIFLLSEKQQHSDSPQWKTYWVSVLGNKKKSFYKRQKGYFWLKAKKRGTTDSKAKWLFFV